MGATRIEGIMLDIGLECNGLEISSHQSRLRSKPLPSPSSSIIKLFCHYQVIPFCHIPRELPIDTFIASLHPNAPKQ